MATLQDYIKNLGGTAVNTALSSTPFGGVANLAKSAYTTATKPKKTAITAGPMSTPTAAQMSSKTTYSPSAVSTGGTSIGAASGGSSTFQAPAAQQFIQSQIPQTSSYQSPPTPAPVSKPAESEYLKYMRSIFNPQELDRARKEQETANKQALEAQKRLDDIRNQQLSMGLEGREAQESRLDKPGGTVAGAAQASSLIGRRTNAELARLAVRESAAANTLNAYINAQEQANKVYNAILEAGGTLFEAEQAAMEAQEGFTLSPGQVRYDAQGNPIAGGASGLGGGYTAGADPTADAWVKLVQSGQAKIDNVPAEYRGVVAQGLAGAPKGDDPKAQYVRSQADEALTNISTALGFLDNAEADFKLSESAIGRAVGGLVPGSQTADLNAALSTVRALVGFNALQKMREASPTGGALGQITERELAFLQSVEGSLNTNQSTEQLTATIQRIQKSFLTLKLVNSPDGTVFELDGDEYVKYGDQLIPAGDFSSAGNASASNLPQRNNNPGNVKAGGLADGLAVGTDSQGHLIFPSPEAGFQALQMDLQAKIAGRSRYLPPNPTIAQLGKVYAEDPNWPKSVARMLGVDPNTPTGQVDFNQLMQAVARQEGFYA